MIRKLGFILFTAILLLSVIQPNQSQAASANGSFSDTKGHWAEATINWAVEQGIVTGYSDGTFQPNMYVSEAEFLVMLLRAFHADLPEVAEQTHWADSYYAFASSMNYPTSGATNLPYRNGLRINRSYVAELISAADGCNLLYLSAVRYVLAKGYATGSDPDHITIESFQPGELLTRAEAVTFIHNLQKKGFKKLKKNPEQRTGTGHMPEAFFNIDPMGPAIYKLLEEKYEGSDTFRVFYNYDFDELDVWKISKNMKTMVTDDGSNVQVPDINRIITVNFQNDPDTGSKRIYLVNNDQDTLELGVTILKAAGFNADTSFAAILNQVYTSGQSYSEAGINVNKTGGIEIHF